MKIPHPLPTVLAVLILSGAGLINPIQAQHFTNCLSSQDTGSDATVIIPDTVETLFPNGASLAEGDEVALYTSDGTCAGLVVWSSSSSDAKSFAAAGPNTTATNSSLSGYESGESLKYKIWDESENQVYDLKTAADYKACDDSAFLCRDDGTYEDDAIITVSKLGNSSTLPVELTKFEAIQDEGQVRLEWTTASETNNVGFDVQHRTSTSDWSTLDHVEGAGTTSTPQHYRHLVTDLEAGRHHFRLQQTDANGGTSLSDPITVELTMEETYELSGISPNPVRRQGQMVLRVRKTQTVSVALFNTLGQRVQVLHHGPLSANDAHVLRVNGRTLSSGRYFLRVQGETFSTTQQLTFIP